jgi:hypothetical protein
MTLKERFAPLLALSNGWLDGYGKPIDRDGIAWMIDCLEIALPSDIILPYVYPMHDGGIKPIVRP